MANYTATTGQINHRFRTFNSKDYYIYFYPTADYLYLPTIPESVTDSASPSFTPTSILGRSAPVQTYSGTGARSLTFNLELHRDMMWEINYDSNPWTGVTLDDDYVDMFIKKIQAMALPEYSIAEKMVNPPMAAVSLGNDIFIKGVVTGTVQVSYKLPLLRTDKYALVSVQFTITEVVPYSASLIGGTKNGNGVQNKDGLGSKRNAGVNLLTHQLYKVGS